MKKQAKLLCVLTIGLFSTITAKGLEAQNPATLCDRFVVEQEKNQCDDKIKKLSPDWYLAELCGKQEDTNLFYQCIEIKGKFSVSKLEDCSKNEITDKGRLKCATEAIAKAPSEVYQTAKINRAEEKTQEAPVVKKQKTGSTRLSERY